MKRILSTLLVFALAIPLFVNCKKDKGVPVESFSLDPVTVYLNDGDTHQLDVCDSAAWKSQERRVYVFSCLGFR